MLRTISLTAVSLGLFALFAVAGTSPLAAGGTRAALNKNKYGGKDGKVPKGGKKKYGGGIDSVPKDERIVWFVPDTEVFEVAAKDKQPVILYFPEEDLDMMDASVEVFGKDIAKVSDDSAIFVMVEHNADRTPSFNDGSKIPTSKFLSANLSRDYNVTKTPTYILCDWYGNEYDRYTKNPTEKDLLKNIESVKSQMEKQDKKLAVTLEEAKKALEAKDIKDFLKAALKNMKTGFIGLESAEETIKLYRKVCDDAREEVNQILEDRPEDAKTRLKDMSKLYKDTDVEKEIDDAQDILKG